MKYILTNPFMAIFLILPLLRLFIKYKSIIKLNIVFTILIQVFLGWALLIGYNNYYDFQLKSELKNYGYDYEEIHDPNEKLIPEVEHILGIIIGDGGRNVSTFCFGWLFSIIYFIPFLVLYYLVKLIFYIKNKRGSNATI